MSRLRHPSSRPVVAGSVLAALLVVALVTLVLLPGDRQERTGTAAAATTGATEPSGTSGTPSPAQTSATAETSAPAGPTDDATALPASLPDVPLDEPTRVEDVAVSLVTVESIQGTATGPGNVAGPAVRVTVRLDNGTRRPLDLLGVVVDLAHGPERQPASPLNDPSARPFSGTLGPGDDAEGIYVFSVPADPPGPVTVSVGYQPGAPYAVFTGTL